MIDVELENAIQEAGVEVYTMDYPRDKKVKYLKFINSNVTKSLNVATSIFTGFKTIFGGNLNFYNELLSNVRREAMLSLLSQAKSIKASALVGLRIDLTEINGIISIYCYATAIKYLSKNSKIDKEIKVEEEQE